MKTRVQRIAIAFSGALIAAATVAALPVPALAALQAAGPISTVHGFPLWYQDTTGLAIQPCLGVNPDGTGLGDPNCGLLAAPNFDPALPVSFPANFPSEFFYWFVTANPLRIGPSGVKATFRIALEGSFLTPVSATCPDGACPVQGKQSAFLRVNLRIPLIAGALAPNSTYTVTEPFGTFTFTTDATGKPSSGAGQVHRDQDGGLVALDFVSLLPATNTHIGPFLKSVLPVPPAGYLGNAITLSTITPGPNGAFLRIDGPVGQDIDPGTPGVQTSIQTNMWNVVGKIAVIDTVPPAITSVTPATTVAGATNVVLSANVTDNLGVTAVTADLGALSNNFTAALNGSQVVPSTASPATGSGTFVIDTVAKTLTFNVGASGLTGTPITGIHIHGSAVPPGGAAGSNAPVAFDLGTILPASGVWHYPAALEPEILAGRTYVDIHTALFPGGEIRGQILPTPDVRNMVRTAGTPTAGTWGLVIPSITRTGAIAIPITATDGSNPVTVTHSLFAQVLSSVSVAPAAATVAIGATQPLTASPLDQAGNPFTGAATTITWSSSNPGVATVSATGLVTGVSAGSATITASAASGATTVTGSSAITVPAATPVLTSVSVTPATATIGIGATRQLTASPLDQNGAAFAGATVTWSSSAPAVATVSATGLVTGVSAGSATITASATSGATTVTGNSTITVSAGAPVCQTGADTNGDGIISNLEILAYIGQWRIGAVTNLLILKAIGFWRVGTGC